MPSKEIHKELAQAIEDNEPARVVKLLRFHPELAEPAGWTPPPLHCASLWDRPRIASLFLNAGANIERLDPDSQTTPLRYAVMYCKPEMIRLFHSYGANCGPILEGGTTAYQLACECREGKYEDYEDLPAKETYQPIVALLEELGAATP